MCKFDKGLVQVIAELGKISLVQPQGMLYFQVILLRIGLAGQKDLYRVARNEVHDGKDQHAHAENDHQKPEQSF